MRIFFFFSFKYIIRIKSDGIKVVFSGVTSMEYLLIIGFAGVRHDLCRLIQLKKFPYAEGQGSINSNRRVIFNNPR